MNWRKWWAYLSEFRLKMETHVHKKLLEEIQARRIAYLRWKLSENPENKLLKHHLSTIDKNNDNETTLRENQQNQLSDFS